MINVKRFFRLILLLIVAVMPVSTAGALPGLDFNFRIWGGDLAIRWPVPAGDPHGTTKILTFVGGGSEDAWFFTEQQDSTLINLAGGIGIQRDFAFGGQELAVTGIMRSRWENLTPDGQKLIENTLQAAAGIRSAAAAPLFIGPFPWSYDLEATAAWSPSLGLADEANYLR
ncbi:MAG: hypothetical protein HN368_03215, partial [Spirochaetales bacterium]|nr:hypothetical protein [Spirochaetales bacterium]